MMCRDQLRVWLSVHVYELREQELDAALPDDPPHVLGLALLRLAESLCCRSHAGRYTPRSPPRPVGAVRTNRVATLLTVRVALAGWGPPDRNQDAAADAKMRASVRKRTQERRAHFDTHLSPEE